jgi:hypothetical protein
VTLVAAPALTPRDEEQAVELVSPLLPVEARAAGVALLGGSRVSLVRIIDVPGALVRAVLQLRGQVPEAQHPGWLPHVTLARRMRRADVSRALEVLGHEDTVLRLTALRRWDPEAGVVREV